MEVARSNMANPSLMEAKGGCPPGARDAAGGFSQVSRVESINASAPPADAAAAQTTVAEPAPPPVETGQAKPPPPDAANGSTAAGSPEASSN